MEDKIHRNVKAIETNGMIWTEALKDIHYLNISPKLGQSIHPNIQHAQEIRFTLADGQNDIWHARTGKLLPPEHPTMGITVESLLGIRCDYITISPLVHDLRPRADQKSGEGFQSMHGEIDKASLSKCLYLVQKYRHLRARLSLQVHKVIGVR